ncbi:DUF5994 family protein [Micromonospora sagamiensis]|uniref:Uncharacterized protein n=1 Tax=Micromonospora sagamiensis TaxID=47875 RepID=A0A562WG29_9ACTN|nr:DUF5994 family protein [Micromonospora sagamiensis]TWJ29269.1 hypothetical protein JD81_02777 [Micromonospora sagamiensis]BCL17705.1 hypothetical protein GCM10017556_54440 [Micromonospora sagamiensis]
MTGTVLVPSSLSHTRLVLAPTRDRTVLDGGWWPRSWDPAAELPGFVRALSERYGRIRHLMLNIHTWDSRIHRLTVGPDVVRIGWFDSLDPALLVATTASDDQVDLLVVPPATAPAAAERALAAAADPANLRHAPALLLVGTTTSDGPPTTGSAAHAVWDNEGGSAAIRFARSSSDSGPDTT